MPGGTIKIEGRFKEMGSCFGKFLRFKGILPLNIRKKGDYSQSEQFTHWLNDQQILIIRVQMDN